MILLNKHNLAVADFASKAQSRYSLKAIKVTASETVATDGCILAAVTTPKVEASNFPVVAGFTPNGDAPFLLETDLARKIAKALPGKSTLPVLENAAVSVNEAGDATVAVTDLAISQVFQQRKVAGQFPAWEQCLPSAEPKVRIVLDAHYLLTIAKAVLAFSPNAKVVLELNTAETAMKFSAKNNETGQTMTGALMPTRE